MRYYTIYNDGLLTANNEYALKRFYNDVRELPEDYEEGKYIVVEKEIPIEVPDYDPETGEQTGTHTEYIKVKELVLNPEWDSIELARAKTAKIQENDTARDSALIAGVTYRDVLFDSDTDQKINLLAIVTTMSDEDVITWFGMDNVPLECTKEDLINIGALITQLHSFCWNKNAQIKALIANAQTVEEVNAIEIDYTLTEGEE